MILIISSFEARVCVRVIIWTMRRKSNTKSDILGVGILVRRRVCLGVGSIRGDGVAAEAPKLSREIGMLSLQPLNIE